MLEHLAEFLGRTHLVLLHFPIALLIVAAFVEVSCALRPRLQRRAAAPPYAPSAAGAIMFAFALLATAASVITGLILGFDAPEKVDLHRILGIVTAVLVLLTATALLAARRTNPGGAPRLYLALLVISAAAVGLTGHLGGDLTHGKGFLTRPLLAIFQPPTTPTPTAAIDPAAHGLTQAQLDVYLQQIQPILDASCIECHGQEEAENDVRLDAIEHVLDPDLSIIARGDPLASDLVYLIELPADDPDVMPPQDHADPLSAQQINAIRAWVESLSE